MRRKDREITDKSIINKIIQKSLVCHVGLVDGNRPYIIPMNFGYQNNTIYFHSALIGKKIDLIKQNNNVCFEFDVNVEIIEGKHACNWSIKYQSIIGYGKAVFISDITEKTKALNIIMMQYSNRTFMFDEKQLNKTAIIKVEIESMTGKFSGI